MPDHSHRQVYSRNILSSLITLTLLTMPLLMPFRQLLQLLRQHLPLPFLCCVSFCRFNQYLVLEIKLIWICFAAQVFESSIKQLRLFSQIELYDNLLFKFLNVGVWIIIRSLKWLFPSTILSLLFLLSNFVKPYQWVFVITITFVAYENILNPQRPKCHMTRMTCVRQKPRPAWL